MPSDNCPDFRRLALPDLYNHFSWFGKVLKKCEPPSGAIQRWNLWSPTANHPQIQVKAPGWRNCRSLHHRWVAMWRYKTLPFAIRSKFSKPMDLSFQTDFLALSAWCSCGWCWVSFSNKKVLQMGSWSKNSKVLKCGRWEKPKTELNTSTAKMQFRVWVPDSYSILFYFSGQTPVVAYGPQVLQKSA